MISAEQKKLLLLLEETWSLQPELRLGQLVDVISFLGRPDDSQSTSHIEDEEFFLAMKKLHRDLKLATDAKSEQEAPAYRNEVA